LNDIVKEENNKRRSKRIEEIADISSVCDEIKGKISAMSANLNMFNNKEKEKVGGSRRRFLHSHIEEWSDVSSCECRHQYC
jgi:hypothetical protein